MADAMTSPKGPLNIIVPLGAGSTVDIAARRIGEALSRRIGRPVTVEILPGAGGTLGTARAAKAAPDGGTLIVASNGTFAINMGLYRDPGYDPIRDFAPVAMAGSVTNVMIVHPANPAHTPQDVLGAARARPGELTYASGGVGTTHHFSGVMFGAMAGVSLRHVPFETSLEGIQQVVDGKVTMGFFNLPTVLAQVRAGALKALAVTGRSRSAFLPQLPTLAESGLPGYEVEAWFGFAAPAGTPDGEVARLNAGINQALMEPQVRDHLRAQGFEVARPDTPAAFGELIRQELGRWLSVVRAAGLAAQ